MMVPATRAVLFDFAGTLFAPRNLEDCVSLAAAKLRVSLTKSDTASLAASFATAGFPGGAYPAFVPEELASSYARRDLSAASHREAYVGLLSTVPAPAPGFAEAMYEQVLSPEGWVPYSDARELVLELAAQGLRQGIVSNVGFDLRPVLIHHGFEILSDACTLSFEQGIAKPDPRIFQRAMDGLGVEPHETLMVGDHPEADGGATALGPRTLIWPMAAPGADRKLLRVVTYL